MQHCKEGLFIAGMPANNIRACRTFKNLMENRNLIIFLSSYRKNRGLVRELGREIETAMAKNDFFFDVLVRLVQDKGLVFLCFLMLVALVLKIHESITGLGIFALEIFFYLMVASALATLTVWAGIQKKTIQNENN